MDDAGPSRSPSGTAVISVRTLGMLVAVSLLNGSCTPLRGSDAVVTWENTNIGDAFAGAAQEGSRMKRSIIFAVLFGFILGAALVMRRRAEK